MPRTEDLLGISYRQLHHWTAKGYLRRNKDPRPTKDNPGSYLTRAWSPTELQVGRMMARLVHLGFEPSKASTYARDAIEHKVDMSLSIVGGRMKLSGTFVTMIREADELARKLEDRKASIAAERAQRLENDVKGDTGSLDRNS